MSEYLSKDILEEGHVKSFAPFHWAQMVFGVCRIDVRDRFVTAPTLWQKIYSVLLNIMVGISYVLFIQFYTALFVDNNYLYFLFLGTLFMHFNFSLGNIIHVRFMNHEENVKFYIQRQEIDRKMKIDKTSYFYDSMYKVNVWTVLSWAIMPLCMFGVLLLYNDLTLTLLSLGFMYSQMTFKLELLYFSNLILYFYMRLRYINAIIMNHFDSDEYHLFQRYDLLIYLNKESIQNLVAESNDFIHSDTDVYLKDVFDALQRYMYLYRFQTFLYCSKFVILSVMTFEFCLLTLQSNLQLGFERFVAPLVLLGDLAILIFICVRWEIFFDELNRTKHLATTILAKYTDGPLRRKARAMIKAIEETPPHFSVYDMWNMDASTLLKILYIITTLIVTLLQFALL